MTTHAPRPAHMTPQTPAQKHTAARQSQSMGRLGGMLILLLFLGAPAFVAGLVLYGFTLFAEYPRYFRALPMQSRSRSMMMTCPEYFGASAQKSAQPLMVSLTMSLR